MIDMITIDVTKPALAAAATPVLGMDLALVTLGSCLAILAAAGAWLVYFSERQRSGAAPAAIVLAALAFFATGFAFAMGGASGLFPSLGSLPGLAREWLPRGPGRGLLGLSGFFLSGAAYDAGVYALFLLQAGFLVIAATIAIAPWADRAPRPVVIAYGLLFGGLLYPAFANWLWGGGWLAKLGQTLDRGHGAVDFAGSAVVNGTAGLAALGALIALRSRTDATPEPESGNGHALAGAVIASAAWIGLSAAATYAMTDVRLSVAGANMLVAAICAAAAGLLYTWLTTGEPSLQAGAASALGGIAAAAAGAPFFPAWAAAVAGGIAGLLVPLAGYPLGRWLGYHNAGLLVAAHGFGGAWGLLAVGLMADGSYGSGWNGIGAKEYLGVTGQGVTGLLPAAHIVADASQLVAQLTAIGALLLFPIVTYAIVRAAAWIAHH